MDDLISLILHLVSVFQRGTKHAMLEFRFYVNEQGMPATDDERDVGPKRREIRDRWSAGNPRRVEMGLVMVNAEKGLS